MTDIQTNKQIIQRKSNFELLRIVAMLMIIAHHFSVHGDFKFQTDVITINRLWIQFIWIGGKIGVDIFVLISGYFLINELGIKTNKVLKLWIQIFTYSVLIYIIFVLTGIEPFGIKNFIKSLFPITYSQWWFASTYFVLYLIFPFVNILLKTLDKGIYLKMLVLLTICWSIIPTFLASNFQSNDLLFFLYLYSISAYVRLYGDNMKITGKVYLLFAIILTILTFFSAVVFDYLGLKFPVFVEHATFFYDMQRLPIVLISLFMFLGFKKMDIGYNKIINLISSATFGVYLIHDNNYVRPFLWHTIFKNATFSESHMLIPYSIAAILIVFMVSTCIELFRIYLIEHNYIKMINKLAYFVDNKKEKFFTMEYFYKV